MSKTLYRSIRRSPRPRISRDPSLTITGAFDALLAKLTGASARLERSRSKRRR